MKRKNKIDFFSDRDLYDTVAMDEYSWQFSRIIFGIHSELGSTFNGFVVVFITFLYLRINVVAANKFRIPSNASLDTLVYNEDQNFFREIFNRYKIICETHALLDETTSIFEPYFMAGANKLSVEYQQNFAKELFEYVRSEKGFINRFFGLFFKGTWFTQLLAEDTTDSAYPDFYEQIRHLAPVLNIQPDEKQLCTPIFYNTYLDDTFKRSGLPKNVCKKLYKKQLDNIITAVQVDPVLWAIDTLEAVFFRGIQQTTSREVALLKIHNNIVDVFEDGFNVIFLPEANNNSIPDVGPITISNISMLDDDSFAISDVVVEKKIEGSVEKGFDSNELYYLAFLYSLLKHSGRMLVRLDEKAEAAISGECNIDDPYHTDKLLAFFVDNNLIEAMIQTKYCTFMLIDKNKPGSKYDKILFYYAQDFGYFYVGHYVANNENLASCIKEYSCEEIQIKHDEGACIVSNKEIRLNNYCLLPKKYIYDYDRITANAEFQVVRHLAHDLSPKLSTVDSVMKHLIHFIESHELLQVPLQEQYYEGQTLEPVGEAIDNARRDISQMHKLIKDTRKVITEEISLEEFRIVNLRDFLEATKKKYTNRSIALQIDCDQEIEYEMHETSFAEMIDNFVRNAEIHGFVSGAKRTESKIVIVVTKQKNDPNLIVEIKNNGKPLPVELTVGKFICFGSRGKNSPGDGLGGALINKVIRAHRGRLEIVRNDKEFPVNFKITLPMSIMRTVFQIEN
jgi:hypothetical protein